VKIRAKKVLREARKDFPLLFSFTLEPKVVIRDFNYDSLIVFYSKKVPLRIEGINHQTGGENVQTIFKNGDDLRQDILSLQMIFLMDKLWLEDDLDLAMTPYKVIGTGDQVGYVEFVSSSKTLGDIQQAKGIGAFSDKCIEEFMLNYYKEKYPEEVGHKMNRARSNFIKSTAGYCVATYVLGIGDRHPDNIMINLEEGHLFHIDFGHFLGHVKTKFGIKRERDPFVFSADMAYFVNGKSIVKQLSSKKMSDTQVKANVDENKTESFLEFEKNCCKAYNILRNKGHRLINMFLIMLSAGMPELNSEQEIQFLCERLYLNHTEQEANIRFKKEIQTSVNTWSRRFDNFIHNVKVKMGK